MTTPALSITKGTNPLRELSEFGQSVWLDYIRRRLITSGELQRLVAEDGLKGVTSNPSIFEKAIVGSTDYQDVIASAAAASLDAKALYEKIAIKDVQDAADILKPVWVESKYRDGYVSLEVSPLLAHDTAGTIDEARRLFRSGNVLIAHAAFVSGRLKTPPAAALFDVLELFAFVRPGAPCIPSALGLARAMGLMIPHTAEQQAEALRDAAIALLDLVQHAPEEPRQHMRQLAMTMGRAGWKWAGAIIDRLGEPEGKLHPIAGMETWRGLPEWEDSAAPDKPANKAAQKSSLEGPAAYAPHGEGENVRAKAGDPAKKKTGEF